MLRSIVMPLSTRKILKFLTSHPHYEQLLLAQPRLPCRLHRPYLSTSLTRREGAEAIVYHYQIIHAMTGADAFVRHLDKGLCIAEFEGKSQNTYSLTFISTHKLDREGEASLILKNQNGDMLCEMTFTICERDEKRVLIIGGLQGPRGDDAQEKIHFATKDFFGIFPKKMVYESVLSVARIYNIECLFAVSNETHVFHSLRYLNRKKLMHADYSSFWETLGSVKLNDGNYRLPCYSLRKDIESIASKKRSEYRRRYDLLDNVTKDINDKFQSFTI